MRILGFGTYDTTRHPRAGILLDGLAGLGDEVMVVNEPLGDSTAARVAVLHSPWRAAALVPRYLACWARLVRGAVGARRRGPVDAVVVGYLGQFDVVLARLLFPRTTVVLDLLVAAADTARDRGVTTGWRVRVLALLDALAVACADVVVVDTEEDRVLVPPGRQDRTVVCEVGADRTWFAARRDRASGVADPDGPLRVVFFGLFTPLQGADVIARALALLGDDADVACAMVGRGQDLEAARAAAGSLPWVTWTEWVPAADLPDLVAGHDVCLGIVGTTPKALRVVPNKAFEGAAAGCAVVTSDTPPQRRALGDAARYVPPGDPGALADVLAALAADRAEVARLRAAAAERADARFTAVAVAGPLRDRLVGGDGAGRAVSR